jgi:hypothetical protein
VTSLELAAPSRYRVVEGPLRAEARLSPPRGDRCHRRRPTFWDLVSVFWSKEVLAINFAGKASDKPVSAYDPTPCNERYANKVTEIWYSLKEALRSGQIRGLAPEVIQELCSRSKEDEKGAQMLIRLQTKRDMLLHNDRSPDLADAYCGLSESAPSLGFNSAVAMTPVLREHQTVQGDLPVDDAENGATSIRQTGLHERVAHVLIAPIDYISVSHGDFAS